MSFLNRAAILFLGATPAATADPAADPNAVQPGLMDSLMMFLPMVLIVVAFYFFLIRPEGKKKKQAAAMRNELIVGDEVTTIGGIVGKIVSIKDDTLTVESGAEKNRIKIMRWAVSSKGEQISDG